MWACPQHTGCGWLRESPAVLGSLRGYNDEFPHSAFRSSNARLCAPPPLPDQNLFRPPVDFNSRSLLISGSTVCSGVAEPRPCTSAFGCEARAARGDQAPARRSRPARMARCASCADPRRGAADQSLNIMPLLDPGAWSTPDYVMPFVEGESLWGAVDREQRIPLYEALALRAGDGRCARLRARAEHHIGTSSLNVLLPSGHATAAASGIARALTRAVGDTATTSQGGRARHADVHEPQQAVGTTRSTAERRDWLARCARDAATIVRLLHAGGRVRAP